MPFTERPGEKAPWPDTEEELIAYVREMLAWPEGATEPGEGYGRAAYAVAYAALATFNYTAGRLGITGYQAGCAELEILAQTRGMKNGFLVLDADKLLYPQYDLLEQARGWIEETRTRMAETAKEKIYDAQKEPFVGGLPVHPDVLARWREIAALKPAGGDEAGDGVGG